MPAGSTWGRAVPVTCCRLVAFPQSVGTSDSGRSPASASERPLSKSQGSRSQPQQNSTSSSSTNKHPTNAHSPGRWLALRKHRGRASTVTPPSAGARQVLTCIPFCRRTSRGAEKLGGCLRAIGGEGLPHRTACPQPGSATVLAPHLQLRVSLQEWGSAWGAPAL